MKSLIYLSMLFLVSSLSVQAQKGFSVQKEQVINVSAEELWEMVGPGFVDVYKWASNVDHATGKGKSKFEGAVCNERFCDVNVKGFSKISEIVTKYNDEKMNLAYTVNSGMPGFVNKAENDWKVVPLDNGKSKLVMNANFEVKGLMGFFMKGVMKKQMNKTLDVILIDAKTYAETGNVSVTKAQRIEKLEKKKRA